MDARFLLASFWKSMAQMADSVNINTEDMKISRRHMWTTMISHYLVMWTFDFRKHWNRPLCLTFLFRSCQHATVKASEQVDQKIERVSQPESILSGGEQRTSTWTSVDHNLYWIPADRHSYTGYQYLQNLYRIPAARHNYAYSDGCISLDVLSI